ncbi:MAG: 2-oxoacid:acceptor oxidoreductase family protein [Spirochaetaceae bacterium]|jgi:2-oxoglutarate ferredoxin oxidoreductase subunit gamma|nr:2-oxoacid:acceptor oxidoreductase family protein [Spirochaetaceae bacterium]
MTEKTLFAGFGGQGVISLGQIWIYCGMKEGKNVSYFPFYGAEKRGGIARAGVIVSDEDIASPVVSIADSAVALNEDSLEACESALRKDGLLLLNSGLIQHEPKRKDIRVVKLDMQHISEDIGGSRYVNMVALGACAKLTGALHLQDIENILKGYFTEDKSKFIPANVKAINAGYQGV